MPFFLRVHSFTCIFAYVILVGCTQSIASNKQALLKDANAFCDIHEAKHWKDISSNTPITEFNKIIYERVRKSVKSDEFYKFIESMNSVKFYRQMYPTAKIRIEEITGVAWDCPAYKEFYSIKINRDNTVSQANVADIVMTKEGHQ